MLILVTLEVDYEIFHVLWCPTDSTVLKNSLSSESGRNHQQNNQWETWLSMFCWSRMKTGRVIQA